MRLLYYFTLVCLFATQSLLASERPNIIFIMADDLGFSDLGCYGGEIKTPNLDQLAAEGVRFNQFYNEAKCVESRTSFMTGYTHHWSRNLTRREVPTTPELMKQAGYRTMMVGKWHLAGDPLERGYDRFFGFLNGAVNFWTGAPTGKDKTPQFRLDDQVYEIPESGFYTTDAFTDYAIDFINEAADRDNPFFLYVAHNAPHYPLHAWPEDIDRYRGHYDQGWDQLREERFERVKKLGLVPDELQLSPRDPNVPAWEALTPERKEEYSLLMAVYAAMVDRLDQNIGRMMEALKERCIDDNTLIIFCSDNGACPYQNEEKPNSIPGGPESFRTYNTPWANASNTPFRLYKRFSHEGGTSGPFIVRWPGQVAKPGSINLQVGHLIDLLPTFLDLAGADVPKELPGESLAAAIKEKSFGRKTPLFWEYAKHHAVRDGDWKLVAEKGGVWSLYDLSKDRIEMNNLALQYPAKVQKMAELYDEWATKTGAPTHEQCKNSPEMFMKDYSRELTNR